MDPVPCYNRFDPLKQFDTLELENVHKLVQQDINSQTINDIYRPVDPVPCHGRFESLKPLYVPDTGKNQRTL